MLTYVDLDAFMAVREGHFVSLSAVPLGILCILREFAEEEYRVENVL